MTIHIGPYFKCDREKKDFEKPKVIASREFGKKNNDSK